VQAGSARADGPRGLLEAVNKHITLALSAADTGREITRGGLLQQPLAAVTPPNRHLHTCNGESGPVVEVDSAVGKQRDAQWIDTDQARLTRGDGNLFGIAFGPDGKQFYYAGDDVNSVVESR
jgi:hypothetical protein